LGGEFFKNFADMTISEVASHNEMTGDHVGPTFSTGTTISGRQLIKWILSESFGSWKTAFPDNLLLYHEFVCMEANGAELPITTNRVTTSYSVKVSNQMKEAYRSWRQKEDRNNGIEEDDAYYEKNPDRCFDEAIYVARKLLHGDEDVDDVVVRVQRRSGTFNRDEVTEDALEDEESTHLEEERNEGKKLQQKKINEHQLAFHHANIAKVKRKDIDFSDPNQPITIRAPDRGRASKKGGKSNLVAEHTVRDIVYWDPETQYGVPTPCPNCGPDHAQFVKR
jgi:hypothetical protein